MTQDRVELEIKPYCTAPNGICNQMENHKCAMQGPDGNAWVCPNLELFGKPKPVLPEPRYPRIGDELTEKMNYDLKPDTRKMCDCDAEGDT